MNKGLKSTTYEDRIQYDLLKWQKQMKSRPSLLNETAKKLQAKANNLIPERVHRAITTAIKQVTRTIMLGAGFITPRMILSDSSLEITEAKILDRIRFYRSTAAAEGAATGYGGFLLGVADLPLWLSIKMKMLFEIAAHYGFDTKDHKERIYIMYIFQLTFSSQMYRNKIYSFIEDWEDQVKSLSKDVNQMDWRSYWEEYRDHIDLPKLLQLIPGFGALVGAIVNYNLTDKLGEYAMNAYRMRLGMGKN